MQELLGEGIPRKEMQERTRRVAGEVAEAEEEFEINLTPLEVGDENRCWKMFDLHSSLNPAYIYIWLEASSDFLSSKSDSDRRL